jgi:hypothetical protein
MIETKFEIYPDGMEAYVVYEDGKAMRSWCTRSCDYAATNASEYAKELRDRREREAIEAHNEHVSLRGIDAVNEMARISQSTGQYDLDRGGD